MKREDTIRNIVLAIVFLIAGFLGIGNGSYLIPIMYIITVLAAVFIIKDKIFIIYFMLYF